MKKLLILVTVVAAVLLAGGLLSTAADAKTVVVEIGESPSKAAEAKSHTLTMEALEAGQGTFKVSTDTATYEVSLTEKQIKELLSGTTVMAKTAGSESMAVNVKVLDGEKKKKGW